MAHLSKDEGLIEAFSTGEDLHTFVASRAFGVPIDEVTPEMRRRVKAMSYGLAYGLCAYGLAAQLKISTEEAKVQMEEYFARFGGVRDYLHEVVDQARKDGYTSTVLGRRRYLPELDSSNRQVREAAERAALNAPIQGSAADIIKVAMINVDRAIKEAGLASRMLLQMHDELLFEVAAGERDAVEKLVREQMGNAYPLDVPLEVSRRVRPELGLGGALSGSLAGHRQRGRGAVVVGGNDAHPVFDRVQSVHAAEAGVAVLVGERAGVARLLPNVCDLPAVPGRVAGQQHPAGRRVDEDTHTARGVPGQIDEDHAAVAEQVVTALERRHRGTVERVRADRPAVERIADPPTGASTRWRSTPARADGRGPAATAGRAGRRHGPNAGAWAARSPRCARRAPPPSVSRRPAAGPRRAAPAAAGKSPAGRRPRTSPGRPRTGPADARRRMPSSQSRCGAASGRPRRHPPSAPTSGLAATQRFSRSDGQAAGQRRPAGPGSPVRPVGDAPNPAVRG